MPESIVEVRNLSKQFNQTTAVDGISFDIFGGEILGLLGPNGAGKTTTIQMLLGVTTPTRGQIRIFGRELGEHRTEILQQVNFSSSYVSLPLALTVWENLTVFSKLYGVPDYRNKISELLSFFEIENLRNTVTRTLSSGQSTRVALAKALLNDPKILFLDEPTASLDPDIADKTRSMLREAQRKTGMTILYTSHNMREMEQMSDRILFLDHGRILATGTPDEILKRFSGQDLEEVFLKVARGETA